MPAGFVLTYFLIVVSLASGAANVMKLFYTPEAYDYFVWFCFWYLIASVWPAPKILEVLATNSSYERRQQYYQFRLEMERIKRGEPDVPTIPELPPDEPVVKSTFESAASLQGDIFRGLKPKEWHDCAVSIAANKNFTVATVGQAQRPKLIPMMLAADYILPAGSGQYELTQKGLSFWMVLAARPYPWVVAPKKIQNLSMDGIYTSYTQGGEVVKGEGWQAA